MRIDLFRYFAITNIPCKLSILAAAWRDLSMGNLCSLAIVFRVFNSIR